MKILQVNKHTIIGGTKMNQTQSKFSTRDIVTIGLFAALSFVALYIKIDIPSPVGKPFLHMGNMFTILAALLFGSIVGGTSGSIGMGLWDILNGYAQYAYKTFILKFGIGFFVGLVASKGQKKDAKSPLRFLAVAATLFIILGLLLAVVAHTVGYQIQFEQIHIEGKDTLTISPVLYIFCLFLGVSLVVTCFLIQKISIKMQYAILGAIAGIAFNIIGEFGFKTVELILAGSKVGPAVLAALINLPSTVINGTFSIIFALVLYVPLHKALIKTGYIKVPQN